MAERYDSAPARYAVEPACLAIFNFKDDKFLLNDEGIELPNLDSVRAQAVIASGQMIQDHGARFWKESEWQMWVTVEDGATVCSLRLPGE